MLIRYGLKYVNLYGGGYICNFRKFEGYFCNFPNILYRHIYIHNRIGKIWAIRDPDWPPWIPPLIFSCRAKYTTPLPAPRTHLRLGTRSKAPKIQLGTYFPSF